MGGINRRALLGAALLAGFNGRSSSVLSVLEGLARPRCDRPNPPPKCDIPPPGGSDMTMFGVGIYHFDRGTTYPVEWDLHRTLAGATPTIVRSFGQTGTFTWTWPNVPAMRQSITVPGVTNVWVSLKPTAAQLAAIAAGTYNTQISTMLDGIPSTYVTMLTLWHEPEDNVASSEITYETWVRAQIQFGDIVQAKARPELRFGPIFMSQHHISVVAPSAPSHLPSMIADMEALGIMDDWRAVVDFVGWDPYHEGSPTGAIGSPRNLPGYYYDTPYTFTTTNFGGTPMAIGETAYVYQPANPSAKTTWLDLVHQWALDHDLMACCYFDARNSGEPFWYLSFQADSTAHDTVDSALWGTYYTEEASAVDLEFYLNAAGVWKPQYTEWM